MSPTVLPAKLTGPQVKVGAPESFAERVRGALTPLNLHFAGVGLLALVNLYLLIHMAFAWQTARSQDASAMVQQTARMHSAELAAQPLRGLDGKLSQATASADSFYERRLPFADSQVIGELGALAKRQGVKLSRVSLGYGPVLEGSNRALTEVRMDATLSGDYRLLMVFINSLERDRLFFLVGGITLTGQQSGTVNLRMKLYSYLRAPVDRDRAAKAVSFDAEGVAKPDAGQAEEPQ